MKHPELGPLAGHYLPEAGWRGAASPSMAFYMWAMENRVTSWTCPELYGYFVGLCYWWWQFVTIVPT